MYQLSITTAMLCYKQPQALQAMGNCSLLSVWVQLQGGQGAPLPLAGFSHMPGAGRLSADLEWPPLW